MSETDNRPAWTGRPGMYEVWYLTFSEPSGRAGYWIRYTLHAPKRGEPRARLWFARSDREDPARTFGINRGAPVDDFVVDTEGFEVSVGGATLRSGALAGELQGGGHRVRWDLAFEAGGPTYRILPDALYRGSIAPSKPFVPNPDARFFGTIEVDGERVRLDGAPGQQGHVYGERHAERWAWVHASGFEGADGVVFEGLSAQGRRGPLKTPHTTFLGLRWEGEWLRFARVARRRDWDLGRWRIDLANRDHHLFGMVTASAGTLVRTRYEDPDGLERFCHNSTAASVRLTLLEKTAGGYEELASLFADGTAQAEWAGRTPAPVAMAVHQPVDEPEPATPDAAGAGSGRG